MPTLTEGLKEHRGKKAALATRLKSIFDEAGPDLDMDKVTLIEGDSATKVAAIRTLNEELDAVGATLDPLEKEWASLETAKRRSDELNQHLPHPGHPAPVKSGSGHAPPTKSFGELFTASDAYTKRSAKVESEIDFGLKTLMDSGTGWAPETLRTGRIVDFATRPIQVTDIIPSGTTTQQAIVYMEETTYTNNAAETAEAGTYPEAALALTEKSSPVRKIAVWLPMTDEQLEDVPQAQGYVNRRLPFMLRQRLDTQVLIGNGTAPNLRGVLNVVGIQTQAKGADPAPDAIYKAMTLCRVNGRAIPGPVVINPTNWQDIRLLRTADGIYIWGSPSEAGPERIWGNQIVLADGLTLGTAIVGDWANYSELDERRGILVKITDSHGTFFVEGKQAVRADMRVAFVVYRPAAFVTVTGL